MERIKLNFINQFLHYFVSILLLTFAPLCLMKSFFGTFEEGLLWQKYNLLYGAFLMIFVGFFTLRREMKALEYNQINLNTTDKKIAYQYFLELLMENNWKIEINNGTEIQANGFTANNKFDFFASSKRLTIKFYEQTVLINCIVEPPSTNQITFGRNKAIVKKLTDMFFEKIESKANT